MVAINIKRIVKNTGMLYVRMAFNMAVTLYTSRVLLRLLGVEDYGLYNVVGGVVILFSFLNSSLGSSSSRFITFSLGKGDKEELNRVFSATLSNHIFITLIILILAETIGLYLMLHILVVPSARFSSALWVYQLSIVTAMLKMIQVPYNATIIAHERMDAFAYLSLGETLLKFGAVILLQFIEGYDRLIVYAVFVFAVTALITLGYGLYCKRKFEECTFRPFWEPALYKRLFSYAGWDLLGNLSVIAQGEGLNILLNIFFGPAVNAARAVSVQVQAALLQFTGSFMTAVRPQIIKSYADGQVSEMMELVYASARYAFALTLLMSLPLFFEMEYILRLWLGTVPDYSVPFCRILLMINMINTMRNPFITSLHATGNIRLANVLCGSLLISTLPIAYFVLKTGASPSGVFWTTLAITLLVQWTDLLILKRLLPLCIMVYLRKVMGPSLMLLLITIPPGYWTETTMASSFLRLCIVTAVSSASVVICAYSIILNSETRIKLKNRIKVAFA